MSTYFSKVIKAGEMLREFNFKLASSNDDSRYLVDVPDAKGQRIAFSIYKNAAGTWQIAPQLMPLWIHDAETALAEAIEENRKFETTKRK